MITYNQALTDEGSLMVTSKNDRGLVQKIQNRGKYVFRLDKNESITHSRRSLSV